MNTPSWRQIIVTVIITSLLCLFPLLPTPILQQQTLHLLMCLPIMVWGIYFLTDKWFVDNNRKTLHNSILWFISVFVIAGLGLTHYIYQVSNTYNFWQTLAVVISCSLLSLRLLKELEKRAFEHENRLQALQEKILTKPELAEEGISEQENIEIKEIVQATVYSGELIPFDGRILSGEGLVNESILTGNNMLQDKQKGMLVWAGSELELGQLNIESIPNDYLFPSFLAQSLEQLRKLKRHLPSKYLLLRYLNNLFIIGLIIGAAFAAYSRYQSLLLIEPALPLLQIWTEALTLFVTLLLVACPIVFAVSLPFGYWRVLDKLFGKGIRLKNSTVVAKIAALKSMIFSKTGVLTTGKFHIENFHTDLPSNDFKAILLALEQHSEHPLASAIVAYFEGDVMPLELSDIRSVNGLGIMGKDAKGNTYMAGAYNIASEFTNEDHHSIYVLVNNRLVGWLDLKDRLREEAEPCVTDLLEKGLKVSLLSGDRAIPTQYIARKTGIKSYYYQQLPNQKKAIIKQIQREHLSGMMVENNEAGDLLAHAAVGIELESVPDFNQSTEKNVEVSIFHHRLLLVNELVDVCRSLTNRIRWIIILAVIYHIFVLILASFGYFSLILAAAISFIMWSITFLLLKI